MGAESSTADEEMDDKADDTGEDQDEEPVILFFISALQCVSFFLVWDWRDICQAGYPHHRVLSGLHLQHCFLLATLGTQSGSCWYAYITYMVHVHT